MGDMRRNGYLFSIATMGLFLFVVDWYTVQGVRTLVYGSAYEGGALAAGLSAFLFLVTIATFASITFIRRSGATPPLVRFVLHTFLILFVAQLVLMAVLFTEDVFRVIAAAVTDGGMPGRSRLVSELGVVLASLPMMALVYGVAKGRHDYRVHRHTIWFDDLPEQFDGFRITQISDVHAGSLRSRKAVERAIDLINAEKSDLFVFTGDLVNNRAEEAEPWIETFSRIKAPFGKYAVLGNHDYGDYVMWPSISAKRANLERLARHHAAMGHRLLMNESVRIEKDGVFISLIGIENWGLGFSQYGNLSRALEGVDPNSFKVLLSHDPSHWAAEVKNHHQHIHLTLAGHTHGMQFGIEVGRMRWSPVKYRYSHWAGLDGSDNRFLHINRGFGVLAYEGRFGIWPEITVIELRRRR
jgi:predicted MPP superfamily phosphohydrolase